MEFTLPRGTKDILPDETPYWAHVEGLARRIFLHYNYKEIRTPMFESTQLFNRAISESEIVEKEMYSFKDKGGRDITLRPEGTAPIARAYITNQMGRGVQENKLFYIGPMFRYERPQAGRYRQFHQIGLESIGSAHPFTDAEIIALTYRLFTSLGLRNVKIYINSVGSETCRPVIEARVKQFLAANIDQLSEKLQETFKKNPLKILDSKDPKLQTYLSGLPDLREALSQDSRDHFNLVLSHLDALSIPFEYKPHLVRGLDYYTETVFEVISDDLGAQNSICGGGRYNNLIKDIGGKTTPAIGFAFGIERIIMLMKSQHISIPEPQNLIYIASLDEAYLMTRVQFAESLRNEGHTVIIPFAKRDLNSHLKHATKDHAAFILFYGDDEAEANTITVKNLTTRSQESILQKDLLSFFKPLDTKAHV